MRALVVLSTAIVLFVSGCAGMTSGPSGTTTIPAPPAVFFLKDSADITASDGGDVISRTVAKAKASDVASIQVIGYADV